MIFQKVLFFSFYRTVIVACSHVLKHRVKEEKEAQRSREESLHNTLKLQEVHQTFRALLLSLLLMQH